MSNINTRRERDGKLSHTKTLFPRFGVSPLIQTLIAAGIGLPAWAEPVHLPPVVVSAGQEKGTLNMPASTGSNLDLTPLETPASVDIITRDQLDQRGDISVIDAVTRAPGYSSLPHPGNTNSALQARGFTDSASVMRLYDGVRQYGNVSPSFPFDTWSVERIEVLRGPASVIYGDGAIGGVVNIVPRKPTRGEIVNDVQLMLGTDNTRRGAFGSGGAINDMWSYRVDISGGSSDGWVDRGDSKDQTFSGALQLDVSPDLRFKLAHASSHNQPTRYAGTPLINGRQDPALRERNYSVYDADINYRDHWTELSMEWTPNADTTVRSKIYQIDSKRYWRNAEYYTYNTGTGLIDRDGDTEIRHEQSGVGTTNSLTTKGSLFGFKNQVSVGFDVNSTSFTHSNNTYTGQPTPASVNPYNPDPGYYASAVPFIPRRQYEAKQYALFAEDRLEFSDQWSVVGGLRYDHIDLSRRDLDGGTGGFGTRYSNTGWRLGTVYAARPDLSLYAQYAEAADPVSSQFFTSRTNSAFDMTTGKQLEIGIKQSLAEDKGQWTLAIYDIEKKNLLTRDTANPALSIPVGQQSSTGIEGTLLLNLARDWQFDANAALLNARYDDFTDSVGGVPVSRNGKTPTDVPEKLANAWLSWRFMPAWKAGAGLRYVGERYADRANTIKMPSYTLTDLALEWQADKRTSIVLRGLNVFDKAYFTTAYYNQTQWLYGPGRQVMLTLNYRF